MSQQIFHVLKSLIYFGPVFKKSHYSVQLGKLQSDIRQQSPDTHGVWGAACGRGPCLAHAGDLPSRRADGLASSSPGQVAHPRLDFFDRQEVLPHI